MEAANRPGALLSDLLAPLQRLTVEVFQRGEGTGGKEAGTGVLNGALHAAFFIAPRRGARPSGEVIMSGQFQPARMKADVLGAALQHDTAQIVDQQDSRGPVPVMEGMDVAE